MNASSPLSVPASISTGGVTLNTATRNVEFYCDLARIAWDRFPGMNECDPGMSPTEYNVVVAIYEVPQKIGSIYLPEQEREDTELAMQFGRIIRVSPLAFGYEHWPQGTRKPQEGDIVWIARYAGGMFGGRDGRRYRIIKDKDIGGVIEGPRPGDVQTSETLDME